MRIVSQVGTEGPFPPLLVEFFYRNSDIDLRPSVFNFMRTLTKVQEAYQGLVMAISPPPYFIRPMDLSHYTSVKRTCIRAAEMLAAVGFASNIYVIVDEAQNLTPHEVKTIITRAGENTKIVFTGDIFQIDTPYLDTQSNGLSYLIDKIRDNPLYAHITLEKGERSELANLANELL
jgi:hypothetical protein